MSDANDMEHDHWFDSEFHARVGCSRQAARSLLNEVQGLPLTAPVSSPNNKRESGAHVSFIGAGPGAPDLITRRGAKRLAEADLILYAGSLVPEAVLEHARPDAEKLNTAGLNLTEQVAVYRRAGREGLKVARVHSGDPAIYGATAEQMRALREMGIDYDVVPGVSSFTASAATLGAELTRPGVTQTIILTRASGRASPVPDAENLASLAAHRASLCVFLGGSQLEANIAELLKHYPPETPAALIQRATQPEERRHAAPLGQLLEGLKLSEWALTTMLLVSPALADPGDMQEVSRLYDPAYAHRFRRAEKGEASEPE
ncbi:precorrin-4 C(11)-methyltransferase [Deinococcus sp.]|uniref:precorrin-4 C(11)-methyltransferase n=1 Tax=Deinococcus sp. TaxID=47478 RepID=UPI0025BBC18B|nr:precorrin-4 C(11)-methyltransferase [Deinococcus sp.]